MASRQSMWDYHKIGSREVTHLKLMKWGILMELTFIWCPRIKGNWHVRHAHRDRIPKRIGMIITSLNCNEWLLLNTLRLRQNGRHFADDTFKSIFVNENVRILIEISPKFVPKGLIDNIPALVQMMAWRRPGDKPLSEPMMGLLTDAYMRHSASMS